MRDAQKRKTDCDETDNADPANRAGTGKRKHIQKPRVGRCQAGYHRTPAAGSIDCGRWNDNKPEQHQNALQHICVRDRLVAADEGVADDDRGTDKYAGFEVHVGETTDRLTRRNHLRRNVRGHHRQDDDDSDASNKMPTILETGCQYIRDRNRISVVA